MKLLYTISISKYVSRIILALALTILPSVYASAASPERYASSSALSKGNWVKVDISTPGLQTISRQTLKNFGFSDSKSVYVYGYGGRPISEVLTTSHPDDLPPVPVLRKDDGSITFFATGNIAPKSSTSSRMKYDHTINPYCETSFYFLSDVKPDSETAVIDLSNILSDAEETFTCQIVHERDLLQCASSGRDYLGEDFKLNKSQTFDFDLPDNATGEAMIRVRFGVNATQPSSIMISANGERLPATSEDRIAGITQSDQFYRTATTIKTAEGVGSSLSVGIEYSQAGVVNTARLDWIEVEYERSLTLRDSKLHFMVNPTGNTAYRISGASDKTIIWDVTNPWDIKEVKGNFNPDDKTVTIALDERGLREFIAFEPSAKGAAVPGRFKIANQNIHGMPTPDMVIITPDEFIAAANRIAELHRVNDGMTVYVLSPEKIYNEFSSGNADVSAFRKLLKMWYDRSQAEPDGHRFGYCLLMGRPTYDQKGKNPETLRDKYPRTLIWQSQNAYTETTSYCTDDFIGMLEDETTDRAMSARKILIGVGRYAVTSAEEADMVATKLESYMTDPIYGNWRNNVMAIADDGDSAQHFIQSQQAIDALRLNPAGENYAIERVYLDAFDRKQTGAGLTFPDARQRMLMKWQKEGAALITYIGHANPKEWTHEKLLTWNDIKGMSNQYLPVLYAATCSFGKWDAEDVSGAELMVSNPAGGVIAAITPSRTVYINRNGHISCSVAKQISMRDSLGRGQRLGDVLRLGKNLTSSPDDNMLRYHLFGDPALRMPVAAYTVKIDSIAERPIAENLADAPQLKARSSVKLSGRILDALGNTVPFNGPVQFTLFDAETTIETHGWGENGKDTIYPDRPVKLAMGSTTVTQGKWSASILMPSEISNNYSPAMITLYAYDPIMKMEANGSTDRLFVYGYNMDSPEDTEGPVIESFGVGSAYAKPGATVSASPVAKAVFSDDSGINISGAAIGHKMSLTLDSGKVFDDVSQYFLPDPYDETKGSITYPLLDLEPGEHELTLKVWDNANNSTSETISFKVGLNMHPEVNEITSIYNREKDQLNVKINTDRALCTLQCRLECFDLGGHLLWSTDRKAYSTSDSSFTLSWNLNDTNGNRLPRGIYTLRATVTSDDGLSASHSKKIAIPAK
ncbi:MAG: type IX secretion system sortase PorU [Muribaculaceae bacterium]|nr:type IX secretion system sortase PorU [Muribaculaceae bacterium]